MKHRNSIKKRILSVSAAFVLALSIVPTAAFAVMADEEDDAVIEAVEDIETADTENVEAEAAEAEAADVETAENEAEDAETTEVEAEDDALVEIEEAEAVVEAVDTEITSIAATVTAPEIGKAPSYSPTIVTDPSDAASNKSEMNVYWYKCDTNSDNIGDWTEMTSSEKFEGACYYAIEICYELTPECGYAFTSSTTGTINGEAADTRFSDVYSGDWFAYLSYTWYVKGDGTYSDVPAGAYYYEPVKWATLNEITTGTSRTTFSPSVACTRAQVVTFLWRAAGKPEPSLDTSTFTDVDKNSYYYKAVLWAVENGITTGYNSTTFGPNDSCTRCQVVTFLYRDAGQPSVSGITNPFTDIGSSEYYTNAVLWAYKNGITTGTTATTFSPNNTCLREHVVTFLYRWLH